jgi:integrase
MPAKTAKEKINLTDFYLKKLAKLPVQPDQLGGRRTIWDAGCPCLAVRVTASGLISFIVVRRPAGGGHPVFHTLGRYPSLSLAEARKRTTVVLGQLAEGVHPREAKRQQQAERERRRQETVAVAIAAFIEDQRSRGLRSAHATAADLQRQFLGRRRAKHDGKSVWIDGPTPIWRHRPIAEITRRDVIARLDEIKRKNGKHVARHALAAIRRVFAWCADGERHGVTVSPCLGIRDKTIGVTGRDLKRQRVLDDEELKDVWRAAAQLVYPYGSLYQLLLLLGQRVNDIARASWIEISDTVLTIPPERYKSDIAHAVPLPPRAMAILGELPRFEAPYIFTTTFGVKPIGGLSKGKAKLDAAIAALRAQDGRGPMPAFVIHDLRRSVRTRLVGDCGVEAYIAERVLGHALPGLHGVYDQGTHLNAKRMALIAWERRLISLVEADAPTTPNVVSADAVARRRGNRRP